ncbi:MULTISPECIES: O-antigen ligase family protein [unclassified Mesorhizobium]|uniref:O-antigen ligase family protein n=1 Tax=unclassified Mesorhizobium TaxID=325217 RepID=UPI001CC998E1|nr:MULTISPECIES: O-antigen ligase [unclassified Mesorhizobium]MBZ9740980.1 O-antigen ligase family protein [Mesorhizobium sp. CO1-1-4]MBZ9804412.1 O-antigen ligase family protein [Mesorhizobium sp. ES1-6]
MNRLSSIRQQFTPSRINIYFSIFCFFFPPILGSAVSFVFNGGGLWSVLLIALKRRRFNVDRAMMALTIAIYAYCASNVLASIVNHAIVGDARHLLPLITFLLFPVSYSTWSISQKTMLVRIIVLASMAACFGALLLAVYQQYLLGIRAEGGAGNAIIFAEVLCLAVVTCVAAALSGIERYRIALICAALGGTIAIVYSGTRIVWLALLIAGVAVLLINQRRLRGKSAVRLLLLLAAIAVPIAAFGFQTIAGRIAFLHSDWVAMAHGDHTTALGARVALWDIGLKAFREMPLFGHGVGATHLLIKQGFQDQFGLDAGFNHFHNGFLTALVQAGLLGALTLAAIFVIAARNAALVLRNSADPIERFGATMIVALVITYLTAGMTGILLGHDILDSVFMVFLVSGTYLACGRQAALMESQTVPSGVEADAVPPAKGQTAPSGVEGLAPPPAAR